MSDPYARKMRAAKAKLYTQELTRRLGLGILFGVVITGGAIWFFSLPGMVKNLWDVVYATLVVKVRELPMLGLRHDDVYEHAKALFYLKKYADEWVKFLWVMALSTMGMSGFLWWRFTRTVQGGSQEFRRGSKLLTPRSHNILMRLRYRKKLPNQMGDPLRLGVQKVIIPEALTYRHFAFMGAAGYGKSTAIEEVLEQARRAGQKVLVVDLNGIFFSRFGQSSDHLMSLRDHRSKRWNFWSEIQDEGGIYPENLAAALVEEEGGGHQYFWKGARALLASLLRLNRDVSGLISDLRRPVSELRQKLQEAGEISVRVLGEKDGDQADGIMGTTALDFAFLSELLGVGSGSHEKGFSISEWVKDDQDKSWVFLSVREQDLEQTKPLLRLWFDVACLAAMQRQPNDPDAPHLWLVIDELKSLGRLPSLPAILDKGRKYRTSVVLGFQAVSQLKKIYGDADSTSILQGLQNQFFFRMTEPSCADYASRMIGSEEIEEISHGVSFGGSYRQDQGSINQARRERKLVMAEEIRNLDTLHAYAKICHHDPVKLRFDVVERKRVQNAFVPRVKGAQKVGQVEGGPKNLVQVLDPHTVVPSTRFDDDFLG